MQSYWCEQLTWFTYRAFIYVVGYWGYRGWNHHLKWQLYLGENISQGLFEIFTFPTRVKTKIYVDHFQGTIKWTELSFLGVLYYFTLHHRESVGLQDKENKRPKGPHIVHLSTMCHLFDGLARAAILFFRSAQKHKLGRGRWDLSSCQVSLNSVQRFQRRSRKCLSQSEARAAILFSD